MVRYGFKSEVKDAMLILDHALGERWGLTNNVGYGGGGKDGTITTTYIICLVFSATDKLIFFLEHFNYFYNNSVDDHAIHMGVQYIIKPIFNWMFLRLFTPLRNSMIIFFR